MRRAYAPTATAGAGTRPRHGLAFGLGAYAVWGLFPLYVRALHGVPSLEFVAWRLVLAMPVCLVMVLLSGQLGEVRAALRSGKDLAMLLLSAVLIGANWIIFVIAVANGHVLATSLGYYINPLVNVLLGTIFLRERLSGRQWLAVCIAGVGVALMAWDALAMVWISLSLGISFSAYGLVRKVIPVSALAGLTVETILLLPLGLGYLLWLAFLPQASAPGRDLQTTLLLGAAGFFTAIPLFLFAEAARRLDLSALGFLQFCTPTLTFLLGLFVFHEPLHPVQLDCFAIIWLAIAIFIWDLIARRREA